MRLSEKDGARRVCVLQGSMRPARNTETLCVPFVEELTKHGATVETVTLRDLSIAPCRGCYRCQNVAGAYGCAISDDMERVVGAMLRADIVVFATPIYIWQATAPMKAVMDRLYGLNKYYGSAPHGRLNEGQPYALIATCGYDVAHGAGLLDETMRRWCAHSSLPYIGMYAVRDEDDLASFTADSAREGARAFARRVLAGLTKRDPNDDN